MTRFAGTEVCLALHNASDVCALGSVRLPLSLQVSVAAAVPDNFRLFAAVYGWAKSALWGEGTAVS